MRLPFVLLCLSLSACQSAPSCPRPAAVSVPTRPPAPLPEQVKGPPASGMTWAAGHWHWDDLRWVWVPGHWLTPPEGKRYCKASYLEGGDGSHAFVPAGYCCEGDDE